MWLLSGCVKEPPHPPVVRVDDDPKVFIMYDNIGSWFNADVDEAGRAVAAGTLADEGQRVIVFHRLSGGSRIYELVEDASEANGFRKEILEQYAPGEMADLSTEIINSVVTRIRELAPADHYGLAFGSHGMGWVQKDYPYSFSRRAVGGSGVRPGTVESGTAVENPFAPLWEIPENPLTRYLAYDNSEKLDISEFIDALDEWEWDFILFDDCFMASVEAQYEMRGLADYFIASPTEILQYGFPYDRVVEVLFGSDWNEDNFAAVAAAYVDHYRRAGSYATISVVRTDRLEDLMLSVRTIRELSAGQDIDPVIPEIQFYEGLSTHVFYDLDDYMSNVAELAGSLQQPYSAFGAQLEKTVVFADHTDRFFSNMGRNGYYPVSDYSGLAVFIPWTGTSVIIPYYQQTEWYRAVYGN